MALVSASIDIFMLVTLLAVVPWLYNTFPTRHSKTFEAQSVQNGQNDNEGRLQRRRLLSIFIALHSVYILYKLIVLAPQNVFTLLRVPLNEPSEKIRQLLLRKAGVDALPKPLGVLLMRLQSFDLRIAYIRFGHSAVQDCEHCTTLDDFALYALPTPVLEYVRMVAVVGLVTIQGSGRERWRLGALVVLAMAAAAELYFVLASEVVFTAEGKQTVMLHDTALHLRRILFLLLPPLLNLIPPRRQPPSPLQALPDLVTRAERTQARLQLLRLTSAARARHSDLRASADAWWANQRTDGQSALHDPTLREMAQKLGMSIDEDEPAVDGKNLRMRARAVVGLLQNGFRQETRKRC